MRPIDIRSYIDAPNYTESFSLQNKCDWELVSGRKTISENSKVKDSYRILLHPDLKIAKGKIKESIKIAALYVTAAKRFSNSLLQLANVIQFANRNKIGRIYLASFPYLPTSRDLEITSSLVITNLAESDQIDLGGPILAGIFFHKNSLRRLYPSERPSNFSTLLPVRPHFSIKPSGPAIPEDELLMYIRSGDIFEREDGSHVNYGQPPLVFYKFLLALRAWKKVHLIFENRANPVIDKIEKILIDGKQSYQIQSASLAEDIAFLLRGKSLVAARGTFIPGVVAISPNCETIYSFDETYIDWGSRVRQVVITDRLGEYVKSNLSKNWKNEPSQRKLMLEYPIEALALKSRYVGGEAAGANKSPRTNDRLNVALVGTSNSLMRNGFSTGLSQNLNVLKFENLSLGSSTGLHFFKSAEKIDWSQFDYCLLEFSVNEDHMLKQKAISAEVIEGYVVSISKRCLDAGCLPVVVIFPSRRSTVAGSPSRECYLNIAKKLNLPFFDGYLALEEICAEFQWERDGFFKDTSHVHGWVAKLFADRLVNGLLSIHPIRKGRVAEHWVSENYEYLGMDAIAGEEFSRQVRRNSLLTDTFVEYSEGMSLKLGNPGSDFEVCGISINMSFTSGIMRVSGANSVSVDLRNQYFESDKALVSAVLPIFPPVRSGDGRLQISMHTEREFGPETRFPLKGLLGKPRSESSEGTAEISGLVIRRPGGSTLNETPAPALHVELSSAPHVTRKRDEVAKIPENPAQRNLVEVEVVVNERLRKIPIRQYRPLPVDIGSYFKKYSPSPGKADLDRGSDSIPGKIVDTRKDPYSILIHSAQEDGISSNSEEFPVSALYVVKAKRFANSLIQLSNVVQIAKRLKIPLIILNDFWYLPKKQFRLERGLAVLNLEGGSKIDVGGQILAGHFFRKDSISSLLPERRESAYKTVSLFLRHLELRPSGSSLSEDELVIHIRSGDVFREFGDIFPTSYGQPPLAFYTLVLKLKKWRKVYLVYEDRANPVIPALEAHLEREGIPFQIQKGTLREDMEFLLRAKVLVAGRGTFMSGIVSLSPNVQMVYSFENSFSTWGKPIGKIEISDKSGIYRETNLGYNWKNSPLQNELMVSYPENSLAVKVE